MTNVSILPPRFPISDTFYGLFLEDINRAGEGGLYPEKLRNRTFEDSLLSSGAPSGGQPRDEPPKARRNGAGLDGGPDALPLGAPEDSNNHGEGPTAWVKKNAIPYTPIPAWYGEGVQLSLDQTDTLNPMRKASLSLEFLPGGYAYNTGYCGICVEPGTADRLLLFAKADREVILTVQVTSADFTRIYAARDFTLRSGGFVRFESLLAYTAGDSDARLVLRASVPAAIKLGFISLLPGETYNGHGLRTDLVEKLRDLKPGFMRFPGGSIVCQLRFSMMVGPVWERPAFWNLWGYCAQSGLGMHEWLQLCEDIGCKALWVFNCGLGFGSGGTREELLEELFSAMEYAMGPADTRWGPCGPPPGIPSPSKLII